MPTFEPLCPDRPDSMCVWRYSPLWALLWAIEHRSLHLTLLDELRRRHDPFEGSVPKPTKDDDMVVSSGSYTAAWIPGDDDVGIPPREDNQLRIHRLRQGLLRCAHASCWRHGAESAAMWRLYCGVGDGVAIRTTFAKLRESITDPDVCVSLVAYKDYQTERFAVHRQSYHPAIHKQRAFEHEQEVRVLRFREKDFEAAGGNPDFRLPNDWSSEWDIDAAVDSIVVTPYSPAVYLPTVREAIRRLSPALAEKVAPSELGAEPLY